MSHIGGIRGFVYFTFLSYLLLLAACAGPGADDAASTAAPASSPSGGIVENDSFRGVIFTAEQIAANPHWPNNDEPWTPSEAHVLALEEALGGFLEQEHPALGQKLTGYSRQYWGTVTRDGRRAVYANFFCDDHGNVSAFDWQAKPVQMLDGGDCYFQTLYDIEDGVFVWLAVNGEA